MVQRNQQRVCDIIGSAKCVGLRFIKKTLTTCAMTSFIVHGHVMPIYCDSHVPHGFVPMSQYINYNINHNIPYYGPMAMSQYMAPYAYGMS